MREIKVDLPSKYGTDAKEVVEDFSDEVSSTDIEKKDRKFTEIVATISQEDLDQVTEDLKGL